MKLPKLMIAALKITEITLGTIEITIETLKREKISERPERIINESATDAINQINNMLKIIKKDELQKEAKEIRKTIIQIQSKSEALTRLEDQELIARISLMERNIKYATSIFTHLKAEIEAGNY